ncbi:MAG: hypothetical protein CMJ83_07160 [Planctomycetes bacterium]|nr:hypothetical protein [Planctomycetota bacterium]
MSEIHYSPSRRLLGGLRIASLISVAVFGLGLYFDARDTWSGFLLGFTYVTGLGLAGGVFISVLYLTSSRWGVALRRVPEAMAGTLPWMAVCGVVLLFGIPSLYSWSHAATAEHSPLVAQKAGWLNVPFFCVRMVLYFAVWIWVTRRLIGESRSQDDDGDRVHSSRNLKNAALFMATFAVTFSLASIDWIQSLEPEWFSTIYALLTVAGLIGSGLAVVMVMCVLLRAAGPLRGVLTDDHLDDLGKVAMGFALFWVYIWYCQYMLIWYTNMPEETSHYILRASGAWSVLTPANLILNFLVPFLVLMPKRARRSGAVILRVGLVMLVGHALDLYILIKPPLEADGPGFGLWQLAPMVGIGCLFVTVLLRKLAEAPLVPTRDPFLSKSLHYHA